MYQCTLQLCESLQWLAEKSNASPDFQVSYLREFLDRALVKFYFNPLQANLRQRRELGYPDQVCIVIQSNPS